MGDWLTQKTNKKTGEKHWFRSADSGHTWEPVEPPADLPPSAAPAEAAPPTPTPAPVVTPPPPAPAPPAQQGPSLAGLVGNNFKLAGGKAADTLADLARGAGQGFTFGWGDELGASVANLLPGAANNTGIPKTYAEGSSRDAMLAQMRRDNREAQARSPTAYMAGEMAGTVPATTAAMIAAPGAAPVIAAGTAGLLGTGHAESSDPRELATIGSRDAALGALLASAGPAAGAVAEGAGSLADKLRAGAVGAYGGKFKTIAREHGLPMVERELGQAVERLGYSNRFLPQSARAYAEKAKAGTEQLGQKIGDALDVAGDVEGVTVDKRPIARGLRQLQNQAQSGVASTGDQSGEVYGDMIKRMRPLNPMSPREAHALKKELERAGGYVSDDIRATPHGAMREANQRAATLVRKQLQKSIMEQATPETATAFDTARRDYRMSRMIENLARDRTAQEAGNQIAGLPEIGAGTAGAVAGGGPGGVAAFTAGKLFKSYGKDALANAARLTQQTGNAVSEALTPAAAQVASGPIEATIVDRWTKQSNGPDVVDGLRKILESNPPALGPYARQLQEAHDKGDVEFRAAVNTLQQTDPKFRMQVLARIQ